MAPGAPLKQALIDAGIGTDVYSVLETSVYQRCIQLLLRMRMKVTETDL